MKRTSIASENPTQRGVSSITFAADTTASDLLNEPAADKRRFSLVEALLVIAIIVVLVALLSPAVKQFDDRGYWRRQACKSNLHAIGLALFSYMDTYSRFPPAHTVDSSGRPLHSWRTLILPFLRDPEERARYERMDLSKAWNDPVNAHVDQPAPAVFRCRSINRMDENQTTYLAIVDSGQWSLPPHLQSDSWEPPSERQSIIVIEVASQHAVHWMSPVDFDKKNVAAMLKEKKLPHKYGVMSMTSRGEGRVVWASIDPDTLRELLSDYGTEKDF